MALSLTWDGVVDTDIAFSEFFAGNHTVTARFMMQFANAYDGPMLALHGTGATYFIGTYSVFRIERESEDEVPYVDNFISVRIGGSSLDIPIPPSFKETWHHIAVVRSGKICTVYLDGESKTTQLLNWPSLNGTIRLGRSDEIHQQFYGFLDDVAVFTAALSASRVATLATATTLTGNETDLLAGFVFGDGPSATLPAELKRPLTNVPGACNVTVSSDRNSTADRALLPLSLVSHMHLPFARGVEVLVGQAFGRRWTHNTFAAFCHDFGFPADRDSINGTVFKSSSPGSVAHVRNDDPNTIDGPANYVTIEQGSGEFCDYMHVQNDSFCVDVGQAVGYGSDLAKIGRSGTDSPHLHQAVTNLGEHTTDRTHLVTIPFPFCNYEYSDDDGVSWHHAIRGYLKEGQWVRNPAPKSPIRYTAAWSPNTTGEYQICDVPYATYRARYDELWPQGWRLHSLGIVVASGVPLYTAVWRPGTGGEIQIDNAPYATYRARYDELWPQGWRLKLLARYSIFGQIRYTAAWVPGTGAEIQIYDASYATYRARYDELWSQGWRLKLIEVIAVEGAPSYTAAWEPSSVREYQIYGATFAEFKSRYDELWPDGWRLNFISTYKAGKERITAVWRQMRESEIWVHRWEYADLRARYDVLWQQGWRLKLIDRFIV